MTKLFPISLVFLLFTACETMSERERVILNYKPEKVKNYEDYLVKTFQYTTRGEYYHKKYHNYLIGIARYISEEKRLSIVENSIGFYYDKIQNIRTKLYLGIDIKIESSPEGAHPSYFGVAAALIKTYLREVLQVIFSCKTIFQEGEIIGIVIGFRWQGDFRNEIVNVWIDKDDVLKFEKTLLTFEEIIERNIITDTEGKIIKLKTEL
jgi:hypothetical protein